MTDIIIVIFLLYVLIEPIYVIKIKKFNTEMERISWINGNLLSFNIALSTTFINEKKARKEYFEKMQENILKDKVRSKYLKEVLGDKKIVKLDDERKLYVFDYIFYDLKYSLLLSNEYFEKSRRALENGVKPSKAEKINLASGYRSILNTKRKLNEDDQVYYYKYKKEIQKDIDMNKIYK